MVRKRVYHNHGPADECAPRCPRFTPSRGGHYLLRVDIAADKTITDIDPEALGHAVTTELRLQAPYANPVAALVVFEVWA